MNEIKYFQCITLDLELSDSLHTDVQRCPTPHFSVIHKERQYQLFSYKNVVAFWVCQIWQNKSKSTGCAPHLPYSEHGTGRITGCLHRNSCHSSGPLTAAHYTMRIFFVKFFGSSKGNVRYAANALSNPRLFPWDNR